MTREQRKRVLPVVVVVGAIAVALGLTATRAPVAPAAPEPVVPLVRVTAVETKAVRLDVETQGTVLPRTEGDLVPEVSGRVVWLSPSMASGGFFEAGDPLVRLDRGDYETALRRAEAGVAGLRSQATLAARSRDRSRALARDGLISRASLDEAENAARVAAASLADAEAALERARRDLERTELRAPYAGRVRSESVDVGQFVERGRAVARLYAVDYAEVRLPLPDDQLAFLDLPLDYRGEAAPEAGPAVTLRAEFAGRRHEWQGRIVRTEGEIDPTSRMVHVVARVKDPYARGDDPDRPPLAAGLFVEAEIEGRTVDAVSVLPRAALRPDGRILVVDPESRLRFREVELLRATRDELLLTAGLEAGERVCLSPLEAAIDGMPVQLADEQDPS